MKIDIMKRKQVKHIQEMLKDQFGFSGDFPYACVLSGQDKVYIVNKDVFALDMEKLNVSSLGLYFGELMQGGLRLSIEGSQIVGPASKKGIMEISDSTEWMAGNDIPCQESLNGWLIIKCKDDFLGCGKAKGNKVLNYISKVRRLRISKSL